MTKYLVLVSALLGACGNDNPNGTQNSCGSGTTLVGTTCVANATCGSGTTLMGSTCVSDATCGTGTTLIAGMCLPMAPTYVQVEHLARPGINEALVLSNANLEGYNATAPSFAGASQAAVAAITNEAKTVLSALYLGGCLLNGALGQTAAGGVHPAGAQCNAVGGAIWTENSLAGVTLTAATKTAMGAYADRVFSQFEPDVMRLDTGLTTSGYLNLCGDPTMPLPLLCGGRFLTDDVIDITYDYLLAGAAFDNTAPAQFKALVSDGVNYSVATPGGNSLSTPDPTNAAQGHPAVSNTFPYSAPPF
jgi:hypothetical protein